MILYLAKDVARYPARYIKFPPLQGMPFLFAVSLPLHSKRIFLNIACRSYKIMFKSS